MHVVQVCRHTCGTGGGHECLHASKHVYVVGKDEDGVSQDWLIAEGVAQMMTTSGRKGKGLRRTKPDLTQPWRKSKQKRQSSQLAWQP